MSRSKEKKELKSIELVNLQLNTTGKKNNIDRVDLNRILTIQSPWTTERNNASQWQRRKGESFIANSI